MGRFQHIPDSHFDSEQSFVVRESRVMNALIGFASIVIAILTSQISWLLTIVPGVVAAVAFATAGRNTVVMEINQDGFFYYGRQITRWENFVSARFADGVPVASDTDSNISDNFYLVMRYYKPGNHNCFERRFSFTNSQDKSEEEIMAAIRFYYKRYSIA